MALQGGATVNDIFNAAANYSEGATSGSDDGGDDKGDGNKSSDQGSSTNPDKPEGTMTLSQANKWAHIGNGEGVNIDFSTITLPGSITVDRFNKSKLTIE